MADFAPELLKKIETEFHSKAALDPEIHTFLKKMDTANARLEDVHDYTENLGEILSGVLQRNLNGDVLPGGKLYWNTAQGTIKPMLEEIHEQTNNTAAKVQRQIDQADGIGLNTVEPEFPKERINGLLNKAVSAQSPEELSKWLGEPIVNASESFFDNFVKENAEFRYKSGMAPKIVRKLGRSERRKARTGQKYEIPCDFCKNLAGEYEYENAPHEVYMRHRGCRCVVTYCNGKNRQNVWSKEVWKADQETLEQRETVGLEEPKTADDRLKSLPKGKDVTAEYIRNATPGVGKIISEKGYQESLHIDEKNIAKWLLKELGGEIVLLNETNNSKTADYLWNQKLWDLKGATQKTVDSRIRKGLKQIAENPGGIILDFKNNSVSMDEVEKTIERRMLHNSRDISADILIKQENKLIKVLRYKD